MHMGKTSLQIIIIVTFKNIWFKIDNKKRYPIEINKIIAILRSLGHP